jgi:hypothetical protein
MENPRLALALRSSKTHGIFTTQDALECGLSRYQLERDVQRGVFVVCFKGVYRHASTPVTARSQQVAACEHAGRSAALSHRAALREHGLVDIRRSLIEVTTSEKRCHGVPFHLHRTNYLPSHHIVTRDGCRLTDVARTLFDAGAVVGPWIVSKGVDKAIRLGLVTPEMLKGRLAEHGGPGRNGCGVLRKVLAERDVLADRSESSLEDLMIRTCWKGRLPRPVAQYEVYCNGRTRRLDFAYPHIKLDVEGDGFGAHGSRQAFEDDRERDADLIADGWMVLRFTWRQVRDRPEWVIERIRQAYEQRSATLLGQ